MTDAQIIKLSERERALKRMEVVSHNLRYLAKCNGKLTPRFASLSADELDDAIRVLRGEPRLER